MQTLPLRYTDAGNLRGRRSRIWGGHTSEFWFCSHCQRRQMEPVIARDRHSRPRCKRCGDVIYPLHEFEGLSADDRKVRCRLCSCFLRIGNESGICWPCQNRDSEEDPVVAKPSGVKTSDSLYAQSSPVKPVKKKPVKPKKKTPFEFPAEEDFSPPPPPSPRPVVPPVVGTIYRQQQEQEAKQRVPYKPEPASVSRYVAEGNALVDLHPEESLMRKQEEEHRRQLNENEKEYNRQLNEVKMRLMLIRNVVRHAQNLTYAPSTQNLVRINKAVQMYDEHLEKNGGDGRLLLHDIEMEL